MGIRYNSLNPASALAVTDGIVTAQANQLKRSPISDIVNLAKAGISGGLQYKGTWNANTNTPTIPAASSGNAGQYYKVSVAGTTNIDGITDWGVGDWIISNGTSWEKIDQSELVLSVAGHTGNVSLADLGLDTLRGTTMVHVSKDGNDTNSGLSPGERVLTLAHAITVALSVGGSATISIDDDGVYTENVTLPANIMLWAPRATLVGALVLDDACHAKLHAIYAAADNSILVDCVSSSGELSTIDVNISEGRGIAGDKTGNVNFKNESSGRVLMVRCRQAHVSQGGEGIRDGSASGFGHVHVLAGDFYLAGNNAKAIRTNNANTKVVGWIDHIIEEGSHTGTVGIYMADAGAIVCLGSSEIIADEVYNISAGSLYLMCPKLTGTATGTATFDLLAALALKADAAAVTSALAAKADTSAVTAALAAKADTSALSAYQATSAKGAASGYCGLDSGALVAVANLPGQNKGINTQTGTTYTLVIGDAGKVVEMNNASANTLTVPPNSSVAFPVGTIIDLAQYGAGQTTIAQGSGVTIRSSGGKLKLTGQYSGASLYKRATDEWVLVGDITT